MIVLLVIIGSIDFSSRQGSAEGRETELRHHEKEALHQHRTPRTPPAGLLISNER